MALRAGIRQTKGVCSLKNAPKLKSPLFNQNHLASSYRFTHGHNYGSKNQGPNNHVNWQLVLKFGTAAGLTALALKKSVSKSNLLADEKVDVDVVQELIDKENRYF